MYDPQCLFQCSILSCKDPWQLAELCAYLVPLIWSGQYENNDNVKPSALASSTKRGFTSDDIFKKFCHKVFKDMQISSGCIILSLYYLQELRSAYPTLRGTLGSEFRIFTTALILSNKYLDDNTFTNKTWSEVSGIPILELNIMEREYLTALNYKLHVHCIQFLSWATQCQQLVSMPTSTSSLKRSSSSHYPVHQHSHRNHPYYHHHLVQQHTRRHQLHHHHNGDPLQPLSHSLVANATSYGGINKRKRKRIITPPQKCANYLPTPPSRPIMPLSSSSSSLSSQSSSLSSTPTGPDSPLSSISSTTMAFPTPMSWSSSMPIISHPELNSLSYTPFQQQLQQQKNYHYHLHLHHHHHHHHHHLHHPLCHTNTALLTNRIRCLEIE